MLFNRDHVLKEMIIGILTWEHQWALVLLSLESMKCQFVNYKIVRDRHES